MVLTKGGGSWAGARSIAQVIPDLAGLFLPQPLECSGPGSCQSSVGLASPIFLVHEYCGQQSLFPPSLASHLNYYSDCR